jgi:hypothetical protein
MRWRRRRGSQPTHPTTKLDREATPADIDALAGFAQHKRGVEFYVEPETFATDTTAVAVAADGEWIRRRVGSPATIRKLADDLSLPVYDAQLVGYPARMRAWNERQRQQRSDPRGT